MTIYDYTTRGGKNVIKEYIDKLPDSERTAVLNARQLIHNEGVGAFQLLVTRQLYKKL